MAVFGTDTVSDISPLALLGAAAFALVLSAAHGALDRSSLTAGLRRSAAQTLPAVPLLVLIATVSASWMLSGVVPAMIQYGLDVLNPDYFLPLCCIICAFISVLTGSSWTTIATVGVAFMGIGTAVGYSPGWIAGAIISGAYFGDKMSPLSDTTVIASSSCNVDLFVHIRYMMFTSGPAMLISLIVFATAGTGDTGGAMATGSISAGLHQTFNITPWIMTIPAVTAVLIALRLPTVITLAASSILGVAGMFVFQPQIVALLTDGQGIAAHAMMIVRSLWSETTLSTGDAALDDLVATGGVTGMLPTIGLVLSAMTFGGVLMGCGMLNTLAAWFARKLHSRRSLVAATAGSGIMFNACTADQYLSIIIGGNMYRATYDKFSLEPRLLSRTVEDSTSVTSVLIPWNSCGITQSTVLGVATLTYLPYCVFNYLSPLMSVVIGWTGWKIRSLAHA